VATQGEETVGDAEVLQREDVLPDAVQRLLGGSGRQRGFASRCAAVQFALCQVFAVDLAVGVEGQGVELDEVLRHHVGR